MPDAALAFLARPPPQFDESKPAEAKLVPRFFNWVRACQVEVAPGCDAVLAAEVLWAAERCTL